MPFSNFSLTDIVPCFAFEYFKKTWVYNALQHYVFNKQVEITAILI